ncbi:MAG TPA: ferritin-like domain-containing protein [Gemmatimonadales bacterium]|jgi:ferritin-like metal-binding protein YciE
MSLDSMHELLIEELQDLYSAEQQLVKALPKIAEHVVTPSLRSALESHLRETEGHVGRLEAAFTALGERASSKKCKGMEGLIDEGSDRASKRGSEAVRDAGIIAAAQRVEHYEIAAYGCAIAFARLMGHQQVVALLEETLAEEEEASEKLSALAEDEVNQHAFAVSTAMHGGH